jgi:hypothetical protein
MNTRRSFRLLAAACLCAVAAGAVGRSDEKVTYQDHA